MQKLAREMFHAQIALSDTKCLTSHRGSRKTSNLTGALIFEAHLVKRAYRGPGPTNNLGFEMKLLSRQSLNNKAQVIVQEKKSYPSRYFSIMIHSESQSNLWLPKNTQINVKTPMQGLGHYKYCK